MAVKVSVCIPAYNQTEFLRKNLESLVIQTYANYEIIITDDSTTNEVELLVNDFFAKHSRSFIYHRNQPALGSPANWNKAIDLASGEYIKIMHHDDWFTDENSLAEFVAALDANPQADLAFSVTSIFNVGQSTYSENRPDTAFLEELKTNPLLLFNDNRIGAPTAIIFRASAGLRFDEKISYVVDLDFYIRLLLQRPGFVFINKPLIVNTSNHPGQVTTAFLHSKKQVGEYCYLYNKLFKGRFPGKKYRVFFRSLFYWQGLASFGELEKLGYPRPQPLWIFRYLLFRARLQQKPAAG